jgi:hypothetical protein
MAGFAGMITGGIVGIIDKVLSWFTPEQRVRKIKDEIDKLQKERSHLLAGVCDAKTSNRVVCIDQRLAYLTGLLKNSANG